MRAWNWNWFWIFSIDLKFSILLKSVHLEKTYLMDDHLHIYSTNIIPRNTVTGYWHHYLTPPICQTNWITMELSYVVKISLMVFLFTILKDISGCVHSRHDHRRLTVNCMKLAEDISSYSYKISPTRSVSLNPFSSADENMILKTMQIMRRLIWTHIVCHSGLNLWLTSLFVTMDISKF